MIVHYRKSILNILIQEKESINYYNMTTKDELQDYAVKLIETNLNDNLLLSWATGLGKSLAFIKIQEAHYKNEITYIIVNERNHIQNWKNEYIKYGKEELLKNTKIFCYASLKKYLNTKIGLLGLDEAHHALSPARIEFLDTLEVKKTVALTATLTTIQKELLIDLFGNFVEHKFLLKKATENNILVQPKIYLIGLDLDTTNNYLEYIVSWGSKAKQIVLYDDISNKALYNRQRYPNLQLHLRTTEAAYNMIINQDIEFYKQQYVMNPNPYNKFKWLNLSSQRKTFLGEIKSKALKILLDELKHKKYLCYCTSINQANLIGESYNTIHSGKPEKENDIIINNFNTGKINNIIAVSKLTEGQNLAGLNTVILTNLDAKDRTFIQRTGRALRSEEPEIYILYHKGTRDELVLENVFTNINNENIFYRDLII